MLLPHRSIFILITAGTLDENIAIALPDLIECKPVCSLLTPRASLPMLNFTAKDLLKLNRDLVSKVVRMLEQNVASRQRRDGEKDERSVARGKEKVNNKPMSEKRIK